MTGRLVISAPGGHNEGTECGPAWATWEQTQMSVTEVLGSINDLEEGREAGGLRNASSQAVLLVRRVH